MSTGIRRGVLVFVLVMALPILGAGCGGGGTSSESGTTKAEATQSPIETAGYGPEASATERKEASAILVRSMRTRAAHDWSGWCATLSARLVHDSEREAKVIQVERSCAAVRAAEAKGVPPSTFENTMTGPITALRAKQGRGVAIYHGTGDSEYSVAMRREGGQWKVDAYAPVALQSALHS